MTELMAAYGSNTSKRQMRLRCPTARPQGKFILTGAKLVFRHYADLELGPQEWEVPCALWSLNRADVEALKRYEGEGLRRGYYPEKILIRFAGRERECTLYLMRNGTGIAPPMDEYAHILREGYQDFGLPIKYLNAALRHSWDAKEHSEMTRERRERAKAKGQRVLAQAPKQRLIVPPLSTIASPST